MDEIYIQLKKFGRVKLNQALSKYSSFKIGGQARYLIEVTELDKLVDLLNFLSDKGIEKYILGGGTNMLFADQGFDGVVIKVMTKDLQIKDHDITAESGVLLSQIVDLAVKNSLTGLEWAVGIPGTIGGAVRGNAGAMGDDISSSVVKVKVWKSGEIQELSVQDCEFNYRDSIFKKNHDVILQVVLTLKSGDKAKIVSAMQKNVKQRTGRVQTSPCPGCFFKNFPLSEWPGDKEKLPEIFHKYGKVSAGWLIEQAGCSGLKKGGAQVSTDHANYIINKGNATQADVLFLVEEIQEKVYNMFKVELQPEAQIFY